MSPRLFGPTELVARIAVAISEMEGYTKTGSRADRNNNPGNMRSWGKTPIVDGFARFATPADGWAALRRQVQKNIGRGLTLREFFGGKYERLVSVTEGAPGEVIINETRGRVIYGGYAPDSDGNRSTHYAEFVAKRVGIEADEKRAAIDIPLPELLAPERESAAQKEE